MIGYWPMTHDIRWYQDRPQPGYPFESLCDVVSTVTVRTAKGWTRWSYCPIHHWVAPSSHLIEVLSNAIAPRLPR